MRLQVMLRTERRTRKFLNGKGKRWKAVGCRWMIKEIVQKKRKSRSEVQKASKTVRSTLLYRSVWRTERKCMKGTKVPSTSSSESITE